MKSSNCKIFYKSYKHALQKYLGIGECVLSFKDRLYQFYLLNESYAPATTEVQTSVTTQFIGTVTSDGTLLPGQTTPALFFINDQDAFDNGVEKNQIYYLSQNNTYGSPFGTPKKLVEDVE